MSFGKSGEQTCDRALRLVVVVDEIVADRGKDYCSP
jgi:hypothetical protein